MFWWGKWKKISLSPLFSLPLQKKFLGSLTNNVFLLPLPKNYHYFLWEKWKEKSFFSLLPLFFTSTHKKKFFGRSTFLTKKSFFYLPYLKIIIFWWGKWKKDFFSNRIPKNYYFFWGGGRSEKKFHLEKKKILGASEIFFSLPLPNK